MKPGPERISLRRWRSQSLLAFLWGCILVALASLSGCFDEGGVATRVDTLSSPRPIGDDVGRRAFAVQPTFQRLLCPPGTSCVTIDMNRDGKEDLVRFDQTGVFDRPGTVGVAYSNGWDLGAVVMVGSDACVKGDGCFAADLDGNGFPDLVRSVRSDLKAAGLVEVSLALGTGKFRAKVPWASELCFPGQACTAGDLDGDGRADLIAFEGAGVEKKSDGSVWILRTGGKPDAVPERLDLRLCRFPGDLCRIGDVNGDRCADLVELQRKKGEHTVVWLASKQGFKLGKKWSRDACPPGTLCHLADFDGDLTADVIGFDAATSQIVVSRSSGHAFEGSFVLPAPPCGAGDRCWTADITGDGRQDLVSLRADGTVELRPSQDAVDRLDDHALRLSLLRTDYARRASQAAAARLADILAEAVVIPPELRAALPERFPPDPPGSPPAPTPNDPPLPRPPLPGMEPWPAYSPGSIDFDWYRIELDARADAINAETRAILDALPPEGTLLWTADQQRWQVALGKVVAARTALYAPPLGADAAARGGACGNVVLHDHYDDVDGVPRLEGSYVSRFYDALRQQAIADRVGRALPALTGVEEGLRCLSEQEINGLETAHANAVLATMTDLLAAGQPLLTQMVWDQALPVELLLYDAVKYFTAPTGWRLLQVRIEGGSLIVPELPPPGTDFHQFIAEDATACPTLRCRLYSGNPARATVEGRNLTLDTIGAWLADVRSRARLRRAGINPERLLDAMVELERLGEGDCPLLELSHNGLTCQSEWTCRHSQELAEASNELGLRLFPGAPGSPFTHFGTNRLGLPTKSKCGEDASGGGAAPEACVGPELRGRRGHFSLDPVLDRLFECTMETFRSGPPSSEPVAIDLSFNGRCFSSGGPDAGTGSAPPPPPPPPDRPLVTEERIERQQSNVRDVMTGASDRFGQSREQIVRVFMDKLGMTRDQVTEVLRDAGLAIGSADVVYSGDVVKSPMGSGTRVGSSGVDVGLYVDPEMLQEEVDNLTARASSAENAENLADIYTFTGVLHEAIHVALNIAEARGYVSDMNSGNHHEITDRLGLDRWGAQSCDPASSGCRSGCGYTEARMLRFQQCVAPAGGPTPIDRCESARDYCNDRRNGDTDYLLSNCPSPTVSLPALCTAVTCDGSSGVTSACCGTSGGTTPYPFESPNPGPHPGDPDLGIPGIPGGPGGIPIPPLR